MRLREMRPRAYRLPSADLGWREWLQTYYAHVTRHPLAARHVRLWEWFEALRPGVQPRPRVEIWPRGGAKSSTAELGCARVCAKLTRRYALYVSETQEQADKHVQSVAALLEALRVERAVNAYGHSRGWRRQELRTANGFNVSAFGLDAAARGVKLDQYRPDLIIFDDIDSQDDSLLTIEKKIGSITTAIIPAGSSDCAILFLQNRIHADSIVSQLADGRADFLHNREPAFEEPAVIGLEVEPVPRGDGLSEYRIVAGEPTWAGQSLAICEKQINEWGLRAFKREAQHDVEGGAGTPYFNVAYLRELREELRRPENAPIRVVERGEMGFSARLEIWEEPQEGHDYLITADPSEGLDREGAKHDAAAAGVFDVETWAQVGHYMGRPDPESFARDLAVLGDYYNTAQVMVERNNHGHAVLLALRQLGYERIYHHHETDSKGERDGRAGWPCTPKSKPQADDELASVIEDLANGCESIQIRSRDAVSQLITYVKLPGGKAGAEGSAHDDCVSYLRMAVHRLRQGWSRTYVPPPAQPADVRYGRSLRKKGV